MIIQPTAFRLLRGRRVHDALVRSSRPGIDHSVPLKESSSEREGEVQGTSVIIVGFTDNKYLALKPASCEARHEVEDSLGVWEREEGLRSLPTHNPFVVGQRPHQDNDRKISRYVHPQVAHSIPDVYGSNWRANYITLALRGRADGMDEGLGVWM